MKKVCIDFAPPSLVRSVFRTPRRTWVLLCMAIAVGCAAGAAGFERRQRQWELELLRVQSQARTEAQARTVAPAVVRPPVPEAQAAAVNAAVLQLNLPWRALHDAVEAGTPASVALLALEPDARRHSVRITAEAKSSDDMIAYVEQLQKQEWFSTVVLARHEINEQDPNRPIRFQLDAQWRAAQ